MPRRTSVYAGSGAAQAQPGGDRAHRVVDRVQAVGQPLRRSPRRPRGSSAAAAGPASGPSGSSRRTALRAPCRRPRAGRRPGSSPGHSGPARSPPPPGAAPRPARRPGAAPRQAHRTAPRRVAAVPAVAVVDQGVLQVGPGGQRGGRRGVRVAPAPTAYQQPGHARDGEQQQQRPRRSTNGRTGTRTGPAPMPPPVPGLRPSWLMSSRARFSLPPQARWSGRRWTTRRGSGRSVGVLPPAATWPTAAGRTPARPGSARTAPSRRPGSTARARRARRCSPTTWLPCAVGAAGREPDGDPGRDVEQSGPSRPSSRRTARSTRAASAGSRGSPARPVPSVTVESSVCE